MAYEPFPIFGPTIPAMVGRSGPTRQIRAELSKLTPSHISVVGPKHIGKSVLLKHIADFMAAEAEQFSSVIFWDLAHQTPASDEEFVQGFCRQLAGALKQRKPDYAAMLDGAHYSDVKEILEALTVENYRVLMIWDGFDKPLRSGQFSRNLWDQLRELASQPSLRLITATRRSLQELIRNEESVTSDFWNIFGVTVKVGPFEDQDIDEVLASRALELEKGARTQLFGDSGFIPALTLSLMNAIGPTVKPGLISQKDITAGSDQTVVDQEALLGSLWEDCDQPTKELFYELLEGEIQLPDTTPSSRFALVERGLAITASAKLWKSCRLMERYVATQRTVHGTLKRQFGTSEVYGANIQSAMELRLAQIDGIDTRLKRLIELCFEDLPDSPDLCLKHVRDICDHSLQMMLERELGPQLSIPPDWKHDWQQFEFENRSLPAWFQNAGCPHERADRIVLLGLMVKPRRIEPKSSWVSRESLELAQAAKQFGDWGQHIAQRDVACTTALAALNVCIELARSLTTELNGGS